ncbi:MAG: hypothetical protein IKV99_07295 [Oscillospiraceae bacterium]|nr:hypothetical protein [Oscillospiraceae bacterium]
MNVMNVTLGYVLCCQSPALFLAALVLLICYFARKKHHRVRAILDLILAVLCAAAGVVLYFLGMSWEYFTIRDFHHIRFIGWVGLGIVAVITIFAAVRAFLKVNRQRMAEREANRANNAETFVRTEEAKAANAATQAEVAEVVTEALAEEAPPAVEETVQ